MLLEDYLQALRSCLEGDCYDELIAYYKKALKAERDERDALLIGFAKDFEFALKAGLLIHRKLFLMDIFGPQLLLERPSKEFLKRVFSSIESLVELSNAGLELIYVPHRMFLSKEFSRLISDRLKFLEVLEEEDVRRNSLVAAIEKQTGIEERYILGFVYAHSLGVSGFTVDESIIYPSALRGIESIDVALDGEFGKYRNYVYSLNKDLGVSYKHLRMLTPEVIKKMTVEDLLRIREQYPPDKIRRELEKEELFSGFSEGESPAHYLGKLTGFAVAKIIETAIGGFLVDSLGLIVDAIRIAFGRRRVSITRYYKDIPRIVLKLPEETSGIKKAFRRIKEFFSGLLDELF